MTADRSRVFDPNALPIALGQSDPDMLISFYEIFITHTRSGCRSILQAASKSHWESVVSSSHSLKSSCSSIGAFALSKKFEQLEMSARNMETTELMSIAEEMSDIADLTLAEIIDHVIFLESEIIS